MNVVQSRIYKCSIEQNILIQYRVEYKNVVLGRIYKCSIEQNI